MPLSRVLVGLGIRHVGPVAAREFSKVFKSYDALKVAPLEVLEAIDGIGPVIAQSMFEFCRDEENAQRLERLKSSGVLLIEPEVEKKNEQTLSGKAVVVTGSVEGYSRNGVEEAIIARGGTSPGSVSKKTYCVVVGEAPGASKLSKAEELGIPMIPSSQFESLLNTGNYQS